MATRSTAPPRSHGVSHNDAVAAALAGGAWALGCSSDSAGPATGDSGASDASAGGDSTTPYNGPPPPGGPDATLGKMTYPALLGIEASRQKAADLIEEACHLIEPLGERADKLAFLAQFVTRRDH